MYMCVCVCLSVCVCVDKPTDAVGWPNVKVGMDREDSASLAAPQCMDRALTVERKTSTDAGRLCFVACPMWALCVC